MLRKGVLAGPITFCMLHFHQRKQRTFPWQEILFVLASTFLFFAALKHEKEMDLQKKCTVKKVERQQYLHRCSGHWHQTAVFFLSETSKKKIMGKRGAAKGPIAVNPIRSPFFSDWVAKNGGREPWPTGWHRNQRSMPQIEENFCGELDLGISALMVLLVCCCHGINCGNKNSFVCLSVRIWIQRDSTVPILNGRRAKS